MSELDDLQAIPILPADGDQGPYSRECHIENHPMKVLSRGA